MSRSLQLIAALLIGAIPFAGSMAQDFPKKQPIKIIVPVPPGGGTDTLARITAEALGRRLGQTVIVENKPGASSTIGADFVAKAPADGYTLLFTGLEFGIIPAVRNVPYKLDDFTYLVRGFVIPPMLWASPKFPGSSVQDVIADAKSKPAQLKYGSTGAGAIVHVGMTMFERAAGIKLLHVPYQGIGPVHQALFAGTVDFTQGTPPFPEGIKAIASVGSKRSPLFPNLPTLEETGIKGATWDQWFGFMAPKNLPKPIADQLIAELNAAFKDPAAATRYESAGKLYPDAQALTGDAFKQSVLDENKQWKTIVEREKIVVE